MNWIELMKELGPNLGIIFFFVWRDYRREEHQLKQINVLQKFIRDELMKLIERTNEVLNNVANKF